MTSPAELGATLKAARDKRKQSLADLSAVTGLPEKYLSALERGAYEDLPGRAYARLYFLNYARALNLNTEELMLRWPQPVAPVATKAAPPPGPAPRRGGRWIVALLAVAAVALAWRYLGLPTTGDRSTSEETQGTAAVTESLAADPSDSTTATDSLAGGAAPDSAPSAPAPVRVAAIARDPGAPIDTANAPQPFLHELRLAARATTWVVVMADGDTAVARTFLPGDTLDFQARREFVLKVVLPDQVTTLLDDEPLKLPVGGKSGLIWHRIALNPAETGT